MFQKHDLPLELWLGHGGPLNPYLLGHIFYFVRSEIAPKDLHPIPDESAIYV